MAKHTEKSGSGTSFHSVVLSATPQQLVDLFPNSYHNNNDGSDKVNFDFTLETESGDVFTIYDWKEYRSIGKDEKVEFHLGGLRKIHTLNGKEELVTLLNK
jgi:hypothetical protein